MQDPGRGPFCCMGIATSLFHDIGTGVWEEWWESMWGFIHLQPPNPQQQRTIMRLQTCFLVIRTQSIGSIRAFSFDYVPVAVLGTAVSKAGRFPALMELMF